MKTWDEVQYLKLKKRLQNVKHFGRKIWMDDIASTIMTAYVMGVRDRIELPPYEFDELVDGLEENFE